MYQALLTRRYLTSKVMPLLAIAAVMLCTAMVLIVWSVMAGFLVTLLGSGRMLMGDVIVNWPVVGFAHYEDLIERLEADPLIDAATPTIETPGLIGLPVGTKTVQILGVDGPGFDKVTGYSETLWWKHLDKPLPKDTERADLRLQLQEGFEESGKRLSLIDPITREHRPAVVLGIEVAGVNSRAAGGWFDPYTFMPGQEITLSVLPISQKGAAISVEGARMPVVNEIRTGFYEVDANFVIAPLKTLQKLLRMHRAERIEAGFDFDEIEETNDGSESFSRPVVIGEDPARVTSVLVSAAKGADLTEVREAVQRIYESFTDDHASDPSPPPGAHSILIQTWEERPGVRTFVMAVKKETALVLTLFGFISITAAFLVCAIFWAMVSEKTRDVGILRAIGASRTGVAWIFLRYGLVIGFAGSVAGLAVAYTIVWNINPIHEWLGRALGIKIWDPAVYYFSVIPNDVETSKAALIFAGGVLFSVLGALLPAMRAASFQPVKALRFE